MNSWSDDPGCSASNRTQVQHPGTIHNYSVFKNSTSESGAR
jgi:hypothetical protein